MVKALNTVIETPPYLVQASAIMSEEDRADVVTMVAADPECGDLIQGTGGVRKVRVATGNRGKSGGARVVYYFLNDSAPVFLMAVFGKNEKANLSKAERNGLAKIVAAIKASQTKG
jgi:hypothetical protein